MNTRDFEFFIKVYELKSINEAAESLFITPQGLSNIIRKLENELNCELFTRDRGGSVPTACGDIFYKYAVSMNHSIEQMTAEIKRAVRLSEGVIRFGYSFGVMAGLSMDLPMNFQQRYPEYKLEFVEMADSVIEEMVAQGNLDVGFAAYTDDERFDTVPVLESKILFVPYRKSRFYDRDSVSVEEIADEPITMRNDYFATTRIMKEAFQRCGKSPELLLNTGGILRSIKICRENRANTVIIDSVADMFSEDGLRTIPFDEDLKWPLYMITKKDASHTKAVDTFIEYAMDALNL